MIFIVRGPSAQKRIEVDENLPIGEQISLSFEAEITKIAVDSNYEKEIDLKETPLSLKLRNGQIIYIEHGEKKISEEEAAEDKTIKRSKDKLMCNHDANAMCSHCAPLDPWDEKYHKDNKIKYLSFGSYREMLKQKKEKLPEENYEVKPCKDHSSTTVCTKCQPKPIYLTPQVYRMVDHVEFDNKGLVENFIKGWKDSGRQRFGILVGKYMKHDIIPLGTKTVVSGIWEPEQENFPDGFVIDESLDDFMEGSGLQMVGMIYTDIEYSKKITSTRLERNFFLSSLEIEFIAKIQNKKPFFLDGNSEKFNSRFVTILITPDGEGQIELQEYMVTNQCMALVNNNHIMPTEDPTKFYVPKKNVYYRQKDKDGVVCEVKADPYMPGDYFLVKLTHGCKHNPLFYDLSYIPKKFSERKMSDYFQEDYSMKKFSNFGLLMKLRSYFTNWIELFKCIVNKNEEEFKKIEKSKDFLNFITIFDKYKVHTWTCDVCTFINEKNINRCEMCDNSR